MMKHYFAVTAVFCFSMLITTIGCASFWGANVTDKLYHCTDSVGLDYIQGPSGWVHGTVVGEPGDFGDTIKPGWTLDDLECLWFLMIAASAGVSALVARNAHCYWLKRSQRNLAS